MSNKKRIEELKAEIARLEKEDEFRPYLAWVSDSEKFPNKSNARIALIVNEYLYDNRKVNWKYTTPLTRKEILSYLPPTTKYEWDAILKEYPNAQVAARHLNGDIVIGSQSKIKVGSEGFNSVTQDGGFLFVGDNYRWILDKDCDWRDSIEYRRDVV